MTGAPSSENRKRAEGPVAVDVEHPQVIAVARVIHHHLEMAAIAGRYHIERKLVRNASADPVRLFGSGTLLPCLAEVPAYEGRPPACGT